MALAARLTKPARLTECELGKLLATLDGEDRDALFRALADETFPTVQILAALRDEGHVIGRSTIQVHRQGRCLCVG